MLFLMDMLLTSWRNMAASSYSIKVSTKCEFCIGLGSLRHTADGESGGASAHPERVPQPYRTSRSQASLKTLLYLFSFLLSLMSRGKKRAFEVHTVLFSL